MIYKHLLSLNVQTLRIENYLKPFDTEAKMISESLARESTGFNVVIQGELDERLQRIKDEGAIDLEEGLFVFKVKEIAKDA